MRLLLGATTADARQMASILDGCDTALYMSDRLKVYVSYLQYLPSSDAQKNLTQTLIAFYACLLGFVASALQKYQSNTLKRTALAIWTGSEIQDFERQCDQFRSKTHEDASVCSTLVAAEDQKASLIARENIEKLLLELQPWRSTQLSIDRLKIKLDHDKLPFAAGAMYNSYGTKVGECHPNTRADLLQQIRGWTTNPSGKLIFWLHGKAGTGKSTIACTMAKWLESQQLLGASFFFKRGGGDRATARLFFPSIVRQLIRGLPILNSTVSQLIDEDSSIFDKHIGEQFEKLLFKPMEQLASQTCSKPILVVVIDALDECSDEQDIRTIVQKWTRLADLSAIRLKLFVTSQPEVAVRKGILKIHEDMHEDIDLQNMPESITRHDLVTFVGDELNRIRDDHNSDDPIEPLHNDWPSTEDINAVVSMAHPLFIVAATIIRFVEQIDPAEQLKTILESRSTGRMSQMSGMYLSILEDARLRLCKQLDEDTVQQKLPRIIGSIAAFAEPLPRSVIATMLNESEAIIRHYTDPLRSVLWISNRPEEAIRPIHLSFVEFLFSKDAQKSFIGMNSSEIHKFLMLRCLELMSSEPSGSMNTVRHGLRENMCFLSYPGHLRMDVDLSTISTCILPATQYACRYWIYHLQYCGDVAEVDAPVYEFLTKHSLHWLEVMSWLDRVTESVAMTVALKSLAMEQGSPSLRSFVQDLHRFILSNHYIVRAAPLQLYSSSIIFSPQTSLLRNICGCVPEWILRAPQTPLAWDASVFKIEIECELDFVKFAYEKPLLAVGEAGIRAMTINVWGTETGTLVQSLLISDKISLLTLDMIFSRDDEFLIIAKCDDDADKRGKIETWNIKTGIRVHSIKTPTTLNSIALSWNGRFFAAASSVGMIHIWNWADGELLHNIKGHHEEIFAITFSNSSDMLASGSFDDAVKLWDGSSGLLLQVFSGYTGRIGQLAFSFDDTLLAASFDQDCFMIRNVQSGQQVMEVHYQSPLTFEGIHSLNFIFESTTLAVHSDYSGVTLWDVETQTSIPMPIFLPRISKICFPPRDSHLFATTSSNGTIVTLWDLGLRSEEYKSPSSLRHPLFAPYDNTLFATIQDLDVQLWRIDSNVPDRCAATPVRTFKHHLPLSAVGSHNVQACAFSPCDNSLLVTGSNRGYISFWNTNTGCEVRPVLRCFDPLNSRGFLASIALSHHDNKLLAIAWYSYSRTTSMSRHHSAVYDLEKGSVLWNLSYDHQFDDVTFSPFDEKSLILSSRLEERAMWLDVRSGRQISIMPRGSGIVYEFDFAPVEDMYHTDAGIIALPEGKLSEPFPHGSGFSNIRINGIDKSWIWKDSQRLLWLPPDYRPQNPKSWTVQNTSGWIVITPAEGLPVALQLDPLYQVQVSEQEYAAQKRAREKWNRKVARHIRRDLPLKDLRSLYTGSPVPESSEESSEEFVEESTWNEDEADTQEKP